MTIKEPIVLASNNSGKIKEFQDIFVPFNIEIIPQSILLIPEVDEPYTTFVENALHKARNCAKFSGKMSLADDSGLCVNALNGNPGIYSARYAGTTTNDAKNYHKLISQLNGVTNRNAYFYCVLVLVRHELDPQPLIADGTIKGEILTVPRGENGFGYDPIFYLPEYDKTLAQLDKEIKNQISHRRQAINNLLTKLKEI